MVKIKISYEKPDEAAPILASIQKVGRIRRVRSTTEGKYKRTYIEMDKLEMVNRPLE